MYAIRSYYVKLKEGVILEMQANSRIVVEDANGRQGYLRITSYNVCYTKLLRGTRGPRKYGLN